MKLPLEELSILATFIKGENPFFERKDTLFSSLLFLLLLLLLLFVIVPIYHYSLLRNFHARSLHRSWISSPPPPIKFNQIVTLVEEGTHKAFIFQNYRRFYRTMIRINIRTFLVYNVPSLWLIAVVYPQRQLIFRRFLNQAGISYHVVKAISYSGKITPVMGMEMRLLNLNLFI